MLNQIIMQCRRLLLIRHIASDNFRKYFVYGSPVLHNTVLVILRIIGKLTLLHNPLR